MHIERKRKTQNAKLKTQNYGRPFYRGTRNFLRFAFCVLSFEFPSLIILGAGLARAQTACGNTLTWTDPSCQVIGAGQLSSAWTVISRHGEYSQQETECNVPQQISVVAGTMTITTIAQSATCGDFNANGAARDTPTSWPYTTGDVQWNTLSFQYGTVTIRGRMPSSSTSLWPAFWLLGSNCQDANKFSGDTGFDGCPNLGQGGYREIDMVECYNSGGFCQFHVANPNFGIGNGCDATWTVDSNWHTFQTVWTPTKIEQFMDGTLETTCNQSINGPMFFIAQIQTGGAGGTPANSRLPATMQMQSIQVQDASGKTIFSDNFTGSTPPPPPPPPPSSACDLNADGATNVVDVQLMVNQALGVSACTADINKDGVCNVVDVQRVVNAALGGQCVSP